MIFIKIVKLEFIPAEDCLTLQRKNLKDVKDLNFCSFYLYHSKEAIKINNLIGLISAL